MIKKYLHVFICLGIAIVVPFIFFLLFQKPTPKEIPYQPVISVPPNETVATPFQTLENSDGEIVVTATPLNLEAEALWRFEISLDTHSGSVDTDLQTSSRLIDTTKKEYAPLSWEGSPSGGHHRKGILTFNPLPSTSDPIKLVIRDVGSVKERIFEWKR